MIALFTTPQAPQLAVLSRNLSSGLPKSYFEALPSNIGVTEASEAFFLKHVTSGPTSLIIVDTHDSLI
jgi:hypothetical protein